MVPLCPLALSVSTLFPLTASLRPHPPSPTPLSPFFPVPLSVPRSLIVNELTSLRGVFRSCVQGSADQKHERHGGPGPPVNECNWSVVYPPRSQSQTGPRSGISFRGSLLGSTNAPMGRASKAQYCVSGVCFCIQSVNQEKDRNRSKDMPVI